MSKNKETMWAIVEPGGYILNNCVRKNKKEAKKALTDNWVKYEIFGYTAQRVTVEKQTP